jgi:16S rRNA (cytosine1402-N4)-methyltransferase
MRPRRPARPRSTPPGGHRPVLLDEVVAALDPRPGDVIADCTLGRAGHAAELLRRAAPDGMLVGLDLDADNLPAARERLAETGLLFALHHANFAGLQAALGAEGLTQVDGLVADLGVSSMQIDEPDRGFSFLRDGPLDMRMDRSRGRTAADLLAELPADELAKAFRELGDEPEADRIAAAVVATRERLPIRRTVELTRLVQESAPVTVETGPGLPTPRQQRLRPAARVFQALRILVNRELASLQHMLRTLPAVLKPGGRAAVISFHSGEDRLVKQAFRDGLRAGVYARIADDPVRATFAERTDNPRSRSAKLRWAVKK